MRSDLKSGRFPGAVSKLAREIVEGLEQGVHEREIEKLYGSLNVSSSATLLAPEVCIMLFTNRSGSSLVCDYLRATEKLSGMGEPLNYPLVLERSSEHDISSFEGYMKWLMTHVHEPGTLFGMKASADQALMLLRSGVIPNCFANVRWMAVRRRDILAQAVSHFIAAQTNQWASFHNGNQRSPKYSYRGIKSHVLGVVEDNQRISDFCFQLGIEPIQVIYEDFLGDPESNTIALTRQLGVAGASVNRSHLKREKQAGSLNREFIDKFRQDLSKWRADRVIQDLLEN
ncbi:MAG: hypothetical protein CME40_06190 [Haliea sp.]|nr:hypothetical protein [Haliea sp.]